MADSYVRIVILKGERERLIDLIHRNGITLYDMNLNEGKYQFTLSVKDLFEIRPLIKKTHSRVRINRRIGKDFFIRRHPEILGLPLYIFIFSFIVYLLSLRIFEINISGNEVVTDKEIYDFLQKRNVESGMIKSDIDFYELETQIISAYDEISFVSVSIDGNKLYIKIIENDETKEKIIKN